MSIQHTTLANGRWNKMSFIEQMANIGGEVERSLKWKEKKNFDYFMKAFERLLELLDLTLDNTKNSSHLKELARLREALVDFFLGSNEFASTGASWSKYFSYFAYAIRKNQ